jgi:hypothetical protein
MPKDEFDPEDPMELFGVALLTDEDTAATMSECFIEEFMRLGYNHKQILALFRNPHYTGLNGVRQTKGEEFVRDAIAELFARWGRPITWLLECGSQRENAQDSPQVAAGETERDGERIDRNMSSHFEPANDPLTGPCSEGAKFTDCGSALHGCTCRNSTH